MERSDTVYECNEYSAPFNLDPIEFLRITLYLLASEMGVRRGLACGRYSFY